MQEGKGERKRETEREWIGTCPFSKARILAFPMDERISQKVIGRTWAILLGLPRKAKLLARGWQEQAGIGGLEGLEKCWTGALFPVLGNYAGQSPPGLLEGTTQVSPHLDTSCREDSDSHSTLTREAQKPRKREMPPHSVMNK